MRLGSLANEIGEKIMAVEAWLHRHRKHLLRVIRASLVHPDPQEGESLAIAGYSQLDSYSCGAVAGWTILKALQPKATFKEFYLRCSPSPQFGLADGPLVKALRASGVGVSTKRNGMTFEQIKEAIGDGFPVLTIVDRPGTETAHWVVIYGCAQKRPGRQQFVYVANNNFMGIQNERNSGANPLTYMEYKTLSKGFQAYVCWGK